MIQIISSLAIVLFSSNLLATSGSNCFAPKDIASNCTELSNPINYYWMFERHSLEGQKIKDGKQGALVLEYDGRAIEFIDQNKAYTLHIVKADQKDQGIVLMLTTESKSDQGIPGQSLSTGKGKYFEYANGQITTSTSDSSSLRMQVEPKRYTVKRLQQTPPDPLGTSDYEVTEEGFSDGGRNTITKRGGFRFEDKNLGFLITSMTIDTKLWPTQDLNVSTLLGPKIELFVKEFSAKHLSVLMITKALNECRAAHGNCTTLEANYIRADNERDQMFLTSLKTADLRVPTVASPLRPQPTSPSAVVVYPPGPPSTGSGKTLRRGGDIGYCDDPSYRSYSRICIRR